MTIEENRYLILHSQLARSTIRVRDYEGRKCEHEHEFLTLKSRKKVSFGEAENGIKFCYRCSMTYIEKRKRSLCGNKIVNPYELLQWFPPKERGEAKFRHGWLTNFPIFLQAKINLTYQQMPINICGFIGKSNYVPNYVGQFHPSFSAGILTYKVMIPEFCTSLYETWICLLFRILY